MHGLHTAWLRILVVAACLAAPALSQDLGTEAQRADGAELYAKYCSQCHGENGDGVGPATDRVKPKPRDFTTGKFKFRTTPSGKLPTDADLRRVIEIGLPYTSMPGWPILSSQQTQNVIYYLKTFSSDFENPDMYGEPISIPEPPPSTPESLERGAELYVEQGCGACHGEAGRGDGTSAPTLEDDWGNHVRPIDMTQRWTFRGGASRQDIFRTFSTGLNGTPMPSYADVLEVEDRWHLVNYIYSLADSDDPGYAEMLVATYTDDELDLTSADELFASAATSRFALIGQIVEPGRNFYPSATSIEAQAVYNQSEIAFRLRWNDMVRDGGSSSPVLEVPPWDADNGIGGDSGGDDSFFGDAEADDSGDDFFGGLEAEEPADDDFFGDLEADDSGGDDFFGDAEASDDDFFGESEAGGDDSSGDGFADALALQFPRVLPDGNRKPYFLFGDATNAVDLWFVDTSETLLRQFIGRGSSSIEPTGSDDFELISSFDRGQWTVLIKRSLRSGTNISFEAEQFTPIAFSTWDGFNRERGNKRALSAWSYVYLEPAVQASVLGPVLRIFFVTLLLELVFIGWIRLRNRKKVDVGTSAQPVGSSP